MALPYTSSGARAGNGLGSSEFDDRAAQEDTYFSELLGYSVERLGKEPELLRAEQDQLRRQVQETAVGHYRSFIGTARCLGDLRLQLAAAGAHLEALDKDLPKLQAAAERFRRDAAAANARRDANRQLYATHATLIDLLEVPSLMDTCIRNANFDEALDLRAYASKMAVVHGELPLVRRLVDDVAAVSESMLEQLLGRLQVRGSPARGGWRSHSADKVHQTNLAEGASACSRVRCPCLAAAARRKECLSTP